MRVNMVCVCVRLCVNVVYGEERAGGEGVCVTEHEQYEQIEYLLIQYNVEVRA